MCKQLVLYDCLVDLPSQASHSVLKWVTLNNASDYWANGLLSLTLVHSMIV